jgi:hypothetical protein
MNTENQTQKMINIKFINLKSYFLKEKFPQDTT